MYLQYITFAKPLDWRILAHAAQMDSSQAEANMFPIAGMMDQRDIRAVLSGDREVFARIVTRYQGEVGRYMWRFTRDAAARDELVHDVFVEAYLGLGSFRGEAPFLHWLRKIATRVGYRYWKDRARARERREALAGTPDPAELPPAAAAEGAGQRLHELLAQLPARDRLVLTLLYLEECSVAEAAEATGWSQSMVKVQAFRARGKFSKVLEKNNWRSLDE